MRYLSILSMLTLATAAPVLMRRAGDIVPGKYIITLKAGASETALDEALAHYGEEPDHVYTLDGLTGFAADLTDEMVESLMTLDSVLSIEPDSVVTAHTFTTQTGAGWNLGRISHSTSGTSYGTNYVYDATAGTGVCAYILDTGIYTAHTDFGGRATFVKNFVDTTTGDNNGHGTHVAGIVGSKTYGVAKAIKLFAVKILDQNNSGTVSNAIAGLQWAANDAAAARKDGRCPKGTVANLSLGASTSASLNAAAKSAYQSGLFLAVAAGNSNVDASGTSPANEPTVCTVGSIDNTNTRSSFSNYGTVVDIYAPGSSIVSTYNNGGTATGSGTSMASPHVAGLAAYFLGTGVSTSDMCSYIVSKGLKNVIKDSTQNAAIEILSYNADGQ